MNTNVELNEEILTQVLGGLLRGTKKTEPSKEQLSLRLQMYDDAGRAYEYTYSNGTRYCTDGQGHHSISISFE